MNTKLSLIIFVSVLIVIMIYLIIRDSKESFFYQANRFFDNCNNITGRLATKDFCKNQLKCKYQPSEDGDPDKGSCKNVCRFDPILCDLKDLGSSDKGYIGMCSNNKENLYSTEYCDKNKTKESCEVDIIPSDKCAGITGSSKVCKWNGTKCVVNECKGKSKTECNNNQHCFFVDDATGTGGTCKSITGRDGENAPDLYKGEKKGVNAYNKCYNECTKFWWF